MKRAKQFIAFLLTLTLFIQLAIPVQATGDTLDSNAEQGEGQGVSKVERKVWSLARQGYSIYLADKKGNIISDVCNYWWELPESGYTDIYTSTVGNSVCRKFRVLPADLQTIPPALVNRGDSAGVPNGDALREWINADSILQSVPNGEWLIWRYLGGLDSLKLFQYGKCKLVIEALIWYYPNNPSGTRENPIAGTPKNIAQYLINNPEWSTDYKGNYSEFGDSWAHTLLSNNAPHSLQLGYFDKDYKIGIPANQGNVPMSEIVDPAQGYGIHIYSIGDFSEQTKTYDEVQAVPAPAPEMQPAIEDPSVRKILRPVEIIKVYETTHIDPFGTEARTTDAVTCRKDNCRNIEIMDEPEVGEGYVVTGWRESKDRITPKNWKEVEPTSFIRKGSGSRSITATTQTKTLYVHLEHVNSEKLEQTELILRESEITRAFETPAVKDWGYKPMGFHWDSFSGTCSVGIGCTCDPCECVGEDGMGSCDCNDTCDTPYTVTDGAYNLLVKSAASNNKVIPSIKPFKALENYGSYHSGTIGQVDAGRLDVPDYSTKFVIWRGEDIPTLASFEKTAGAKVKALIPASSTPQATRLTENYERPITLSISADPGNPDSDFELKSACKYHQDSSNSVSIAADNDITYQGTAKVQVYSGEEKSLADEMPNPSQLRSKQSKDGITTHTYTTWRNTQDEALSFYPVVAMTAQTPSNAPKEKDLVFVLSQHLSEMKVAQALKVEWQSDNTSLPYNVEIRSDQWASDVNATNGDGWKQPGFVLDGGYIYQLSTAARGGEEAATGATIKLTGYYPSIRDSQRNKVYSADPKWTEDNGKAEFDAIVQNTLDRANAATMKQYLDVYRGRGKQTALNGTEVYPGATLGSEYGSSKCAEDSKYYLRDTDGTNSNHVTGELKGTATKVYDFHSDYKGNILMNGAVILKQGDGLDKLPREAKVIDQYTKVITNLVGAITRNQGHDEQAAWVDNGHWYNEQSPIVSVLCYTAKIHVGLSDRDGQGGVQSVLDPNLCPARTGTAGRYKNANITQFGIAINSGIGLFSGQRVSIPDANHLLVSRHFYIPDVNAQEKD